MNPDGRPKRLRRNVPTYSDWGRASPPFFSNKRRPFGARLSLHETIAKLQQSNERGETIATLQQPDLFQRAESIDGPFAGPIYSTRNVTDQRSCLSVCLRN